jgi:hypothetical protein
VVATTAEVDSIIAVHKASGAPGVVTDIATPGVHSRNSWHYIEDDPWTGKPVTLSKTGDEGTAVDFGGLRGPLSDTDALAVFSAFAPYGRAGLLIELFCGQAEWCVYRGRAMAWKDVPPVARTAIQMAHYNHIHVAVRPGVFLPVRSVPPKQEDQEDMPRYADQIVYPDGSKTQVFPDGAVKNFGTPFFGSIFDVPPEGKRVWTRADAITAIDPNNKMAGYVLWNETGHSFAFNADFLRNLKR